MILFTYSILPMVEFDIVNTSFCLSVGQPSFESDSWWSKQANKQKLRPTLIVLCVP